MLAAPTIDVRHIGGSYAVLTNLLTPSCVIAGIGPSPSSAHHNLTTARVSERWALLLDADCDEIERRYARKMVD